MQRINKMKEIIKTQLFNLGGHSGNKKNTGKSGKLLFANMFDKTMLAENNRRGNVRKTGTKDNLLKMNVDFLKPANSFDMDKVNEASAQFPAPLLVNSKAGNFNDIEPAKKLNDLQTKTQLPEDSGLISTDFKSFNRSLLEFLRVNNDKGVHFSKSEQTEFPSKKAAAVLYAVQKIAQSHIFSGSNKKENTNYKIE
ncbi:MAG: hypothetical protein K8R79_02535, partial [Calditrichales bacterium]|nr:hypothetical protein [Calditrichales bacterium]